MQNFALIKTRNPAEQEREILGGGVWGEGEKQACSREKEKKREKTEVEGEKEESKKALPEEEKACDKSFLLETFAVGVKFNKLCYVNLKIRTPCHTVVCQNSGSICYVDLRMLCYITHKAKHSLKVYYSILRHDASKHALEMLQLEIRISIKHAQLVQKIFYKILKTVYEFIVCLGSMSIHKLLRGVGSEWNFEILRAFAILQTFIKYATSGGSNQPIKK
ncbi:hypothetical protein T06_3883 [Trichinella sp. T6]|nr:hypothetical protein T06_3883 [Trichinella sp. T6]